MLAFLLFMMTWGLESGKSLILPPPSTQEERLHDLLLDSECRQPMQEDWQRIWHGSPSHLTPDTLDGTIVPGTD